MFQLIQSLRKTTDEASLLYIFSPTWAHIDPLPLMGPRITPKGDAQTIDSPLHSIQLRRYLLNK